MEKKMETAQGVEFRLLKSWTTIWKLLRVYGLEGTEEKMELL